MWIQGERGSPTWKCWKLGVACLAVAGLPFCSALLALVGQVLQSQRERHYATYSTRSSRIEARGAKLPDPHVGLPVSPSIHISVQGPRPLALMWIQGETGSPTWKCWKLGVARLAVAGLPTSSAGLAWAGGALSLRPGI